MPTFIEEFVKTVINKHLPANRETITNLRKTVSEMQHLPEQDRILNIIAGFKMSGMNIAELQLLIAVMLVDDAKCEHSVTE